MRRGVQKDSVHLHLKLWRITIFIYKILYALDVEYIYLVFMQAYVLAIGYIATSVLFEILLAY